MLHAQLNIYFNKYLFSAFLLVSAIKAGIIQEEIFATSKAIQENTSEK